MGAIVLVIWGIGILWILGFALDVFFDIQLWIEKRITKYKMKKYDERVNAIDWLSQMGLLETIQIKGGWPECY